MTQPRAKILVVDDTAANRALASETLLDEDYQVLLAESGQEALRLFALEHPDCVLLDVRMPGMDGFAVCEEIRKLPGGSETPVLFLTALRDLDTFDRALRAGGDDFLTKPVRPTELIVRVQAALKTRKLSAELREHYALVRHQRDDLMRLQLQKERLMSFVVHDLKNPVNTMDLHAQLLLRDQSVPLHVRESAAHIRESARALLRMVLNLLDISRGEEGTLTPRYGHVDLQALSAEVRESFEPRAREVEVTIACEIPSQKLRADVDLLRRVLENLTDNALRHAPPHTTIQISAEATEGGVIVKVADAGKGVSSEQRTKIFERFVQVESGERLVSRTGRGLGLAFCKLAVEAHGGSIWIEDANPGAAFCMRWPNER